jgi:ribonuclease BN (tRNA processing enzyme)
VGRQHAGYGGHHQRQWPVHGQRPARPLYLSDGGRRIIRACSGISLSPCLKLGSVQRDTAPGTSAVKVTLLPSSLSGHGSSQQFLTSTLVNDSVVLDAGCVGLWGTPQEQARIRHVLLSHTHIDHLATLPVFVENAYDGQGEGVTIHASREVLDCCQRDLFNGRLWPDFIALSQSERPFLRLSPFEAGQTIELDGLRITAVALEHVVPTVGYLIADASSAIVFATDTGPSEEIWKRANALPNLKGVFLEATFPDRLTWLAEVSRHLTPKTFAAEVSKLARPVRVIAIHLKARYQSETLAELAALGLPNVEVGQFGRPYTF